MQNVMRVRSLGLLLCSFFVSLCPAEDLIFYWGSDVSEHNNSSSSSCTVQVHVQVRGHSSNPQLLPCTSAAFGIAMDVESRLEDGTASSWCSADEAALSQLTGKVLVVQRGEW